MRLGRGDWAGSDGNGLTLRIGETTVPLGQEERLRPGAADAVAALKDKGLTLELLSGDAEQPVNAAARELGLDNTAFGVTGEDKHARVMAHQGHVAMVGDGLNDTAALAAAEASIAPSSALDASRNAADVLLLRESMADLPALFTVARRARSISYQNFAIAVAYNCIAVPIALAGLATPLIAALAMSTSSLTVLANALRVRRV